MFHTPNNLTHIGQGVGVAVLGIQAGHLGGIPDPAGNDPIRQSGAEGAVLVDQLGEAGSDGLHQAAFAVPADPLVGYVEPVVDKCPQEIALAELQNFFGRILENEPSVAGLFQSRIIQFIHE